MDIRHDAVDDTFTLSVSRHQLEAIDTALYRWLRALDPKIRNQPYLSNIGELYEKIREVLIR